MRVKYIFNSETDYVQSSNTVYHFMEKKGFLYDILIKKGLPPRYCKENIEYLKLNGYKEIAVLQKCFCDINLHQITRNFEMQIVDGENELNIEEYKELSQNNDHTSYYGKYGIAFSKKWATKKNLMPIHYVNEDSSYIVDFKNLFDKIISEDDVSDLISDDVINRLAYMKPLYGIMEREIHNKKLIVNKNFHDEKEWRYVPPLKILKKYGKERIIIKRNIIENRNSINVMLEDEKYKDLWLEFDYDDIRYLIVNTSQERIELIDFIINMPSDLFDIDKFEQQKYILISKILVLDEIKKDW